MSMEIRLFQDPNRGSLGFDAMVERLNNLPGLTWEQRQPGYAPFTLLDPITGAVAHGDVGQPPDLEQDSVHPEKTYEGYHDLSTRFVIPLIAPTWIVDCACAWLNQLDIPGLLILDIEDTRDPQGADGPSPMHPPRLAASWAAQHLVQCSSLTDLPRLSAAASASLFRYRQEAGTQGNPEDTQVGSYTKQSWPRVQVLGKGNQATTVCVWPIESLHWHLPPVEWVTTPSGDVYSSTSVIAAAGDPPPDEASLARPVAVRPKDLSSVASTDVLDSWHWCGEGEWADTLPLASE
jgi:hypothetical protein